MRVTRLMKERMAIPTVFPASASFSSSWATALAKISIFPILRRTIDSLQDIIPKLRQSTPKLCHVKSDGVKILQTGLQAHVAHTLLKIQRIVQNDLSTGKWILMPSRCFFMCYRWITSVCRRYKLLRYKSFGTFSPSMELSGWMS